jgi:hypothetical protein
MARIVGAALYRRFTAALASGNAFETVTPVGSSSQALLSSEIFRPIVDLPARP